jgi:microcystin-dependent protein
MIKSRLVRPLLPVVVLAGGLSAPTLAMAGTDNFIGEVMWVGFNFCPRGWAAADGQLLPIAQNSALFSLLGTQYGGDGRVNFALPDLRGRTMVHVGTGPGLSNILQGEVGGAETQTLTFAQMPRHSHSATTTISELEITSTLYGSSSSASSSTPAGAALATTKKQVPAYAASPPNQAMATGSVQSTVTGGTATTTVDATSSGTQPVSVRDPYLALRACIALQGIFPPRD